MRFLKFICMVLFISCLGHNLNAQRDITSNIYISPFITIGYTFGSGFNYGFDVTTGVFKLKSDNPEMNAAISLQYYFVNYKGAHHRMFSFNFIAESPYYRIGIGAGDVKRTWGFKRINKSKAFGYTFDFAISTESVYTPWLSLKMFALHGGYWEFYDKPYYISGLTYFRMEPYYPFTSK